MANKVKLIEPGSAPAAYQAGTYNSQYADKLNSALDTVTNWNYDPMKDANYQALAKVYGARGNIAAKNSLADAAALNGGYGTSYAVSAAQQARNQYNQELAALIPELENTAYNRATGTLSALREADDTAYNRFRDTESDRQWAWSQEYNKYRDLMGDYQWGTNFNYGIDRDAVADNQWQQNFDYQKQRDAVADNQWAQEFAQKQGEWYYDYLLQQQQYANTQSGSSGKSSGKKSSGSSKKKGSSGTGNNGLTYQYAYTGTTGTNSKEKETYKKKNTKGGGRIVK